MNPWVILGAGAVWIVSLSAAYHFGTRNEENAVKAGAQAAAVQAASEARANAEIDYSVQQEIALEKQKHDDLAQQKTRTVYKTVSADKGAQTCTLNPASFSVLTDSIRASNGAATAPSAGNDGVSGSDAASGPVPSSDDVRARLNGVDPKQLPTGSQSTR